MTTVTANTTLAKASPEIHRISVNPPVAWLRAGWSDLRKAPAASLSVGFAITALTAVSLIAASSMPLLFLVIASGFFLLAPILASSFYEMSRRLQAGEQVRLRDAFRCCQGNVANIAMFGLILALVFAAWARLTNVLVALALPTLGPVTTHIDPTLLASP